MRANMDAVLLRTARRFIVQASDSGADVSPEQAASFGVLVALDVPLFEDPSEFTYSIAENVWDGLLRFGIEKSTEEYRQVIEEIIDETVREGIYVIEDRE